MIIQMQGNYKNYRENRYYEVTFNEALVLVNRGVAMIVPDSQLEKLTTVKYELRG